MNNDDQITQFLLLVLLLTRYTPKPIDETETDNTDAVPILH
jgi:hypothetical protein